MKAHDLSPRVFRRSACGRRIQLQQEVAETRNLIQSTKEQIGKPAPKATVEALFASSQEDLPKKAKDTTAIIQPDGSIEFTIFGTVLKLGHYPIFVFNASNVQAKKGSVFLRVCQDCTFSKEPEQFRKPPGAPDSDRERLFEALGAGISLGIPLKITPPPLSNKIEVDITVRCENCEVRPKDSLFVSF